MPDYIHLHMHSVLIPDVFTPSAEFSSVREVIEQITFGHENKCPYETLVQLINRIKIPFPAEGNTLLRWQILAAISSYDLCVSKLYESHVDAIAIIHELIRGQVPNHSTWGVWCSESPQNQLISEDTEITEQSKFQMLEFNHAVLVHGTKSWCSGGSHLTHALISTTDRLGQNQLVAVALQNNRTSFDTSNWHAIGMHCTNSGDTVFNGSIGYKVGTDNEYVKRSGFWHGGAGIAACWFGAAKKLAELALRYCGQASTLNPHTAAHLGAIDVAMTTAASALRNAATYIDSNPTSDNRQICLRTRLIIEAAVESVLIHTGKALGATAFCRNEEFARMHTDLTVFVRQSHAEKDLAVLGSGLVEDHNWTI